MGPQHASAHTPPEGTTLFIEDGRQDTQNRTEAGVLKSHLKTLGTPVWGRVITVLLLKAG